METRRFDELTMAMARGASRRGLLRGLAAGVLGALALDRSGALAKSDKPKKDEPITIFAKPVCTVDTISADCPLCAAARNDRSCCDQAALAAGEEQACGTAVGLNCTTANASCASCVQAQCTTRESGTARCEYTQVTKGCPNKGVCCNDYRSGKFGTCVSNRRSC